MAASARLRYFSWQLIIPMVVGCFFISPSHAGPLQKKQSAFALSVALLILQADKLGYEVTFGEAFRSAEQSSFQTKINAEKGIGISNSLHTMRLAIDLMLFKNGKFLTDAEDYLALGEWWEKLHPSCRWGGRFKLKDAIHFSFIHNGVQ